MLSARSCWARVSLERPFALNRLQFAVQKTDLETVDDMSKRLDNLEAAIQAGRNADGK